MTDEELAWWRERCTPRRITAEAKRYCADVPAREVAALLTALEQARANLVVAQTERDAALERERVVRAAANSARGALFTSMLDSSERSGPKAHAAMMKATWILTGALVATAPSPTPEPSLREELFATNAGGREVHRSWRDHMLAQSRDVAEQRMTWETLDPLDHALDNAIALDVIRCWLRWTGAPGPTSPEPEPGEPAG